MKISKKLNLLSSLVLLMFLTGCATSGTFGTLVRKPIEAAENETFVLLGKGRIDSLSEWRGRDSISLFCLNTLTNEELECFPQGIFTNTTRELKKSKTKRAVYSSSEIYKLPLGNYEISKIKYSRAVATSNGIPVVQESFHDIPRDKRVAFELTKAHQYLGKILILMSYDNTIRPVIRSLKFVDHFNSDKKRLSQRRKGLLDSISEQGSFKNNALKTEAISLQDQYTRYGDWGDLSKYNELDKSCRDEFFTVNDGFLIATTKKGGFFNGFNKTFQAYGNKLLSFRIACGLHKHMVLNGLTEFKFTGNPDFNSEKLGTIIASSRQVLKIPVEFR